MTKNEKSERRKMSEITVKKKRPTRELISKMYLCAEVYSFKTMIVYLFLFMCSDGWDGGGEEDLCYQRRPGFLEAVP